MKQTIILLIILIIFSINNNSFAQYEEFTKYQEEVFGNLDKTQIETGILYNAGLLNSDLQYFNGKNTDSTANWNNWRQSYMQIYPTFEEFTKMLKIIT